MSRTLDWRLLRKAPWLDTRANFVNHTIKDGALLDLGSSDGGTLRHFAELRPDLQFYAVDICGVPEAYPVGCKFQRSDLQTATLPWPDQSMDAITCMHLVEHLTEIGNLFREAARLLKPGARLYVETPHPKSMIMPSPAGAAAGTFTLNFFDDLTHVMPVSVGVLAQHSRSVGLRVTKTGISRNLLFAALYPFLKLGRPSRKSYTAQVHWLGWSAYIIAERMA